MQKNIILKNTINNDKNYNEVKNINNENIEEY